MTGLGLEVFWHSLRSEIIGSQLFSTHKCHQSRVFAQKGFEQVPTGLKDPRCIYEQHLPQPLGVVCEEDLLLQHFTIVWHSMHNSTVFALCLCHLQHHSLAVNLVTNALFMQNCASTAKLQ